MRRFLRSNIGRPWNKVHQELCEHVSFDNAVQAHVLAHIFEYVSLHVEVQDSATVFARRRWFGYWKLQVDDMYVCPKTGILKAVRPDLRPRPIMRILLEPSSQYHFRENQWWKLGVRAVNSGTAGSWDVWLERVVSELTPEERQETYGEDLVAISKRPVTREEAKWIQRRVRDDIESGKR
ncbi:MAG: hypothetical protein MUF23_09400 [Pirellula sp.]|jgi:hypothetical protein|nr:hypothetical protein [Pirellula sp.]